MGLEGISDIDTDRKERFVSFKITLSNDCVLCIYVPYVHSTRGQLAMTRFFERLQNYMENNNERHENKTILGYFNCTMDKMEWDSGNKTQTL